MGTRPTSKSQEDSTVCLSLKNPHIPLTSMHFGADRDSRADNLLHCHQEHLDNIDSLNAPTRSIAVMGTRPMGSRPTHMSRTDSAVRLSRKKSHVPLTSMHFGVDRDNRADKLVHGHWEHLDSIIMPSTPSSFNTASMGVKHACASKRVSKVRSSYGRYQVPLTSMRFGANRDTRANKHVHG